ncbi:MAG: YcxB family protein [Clostridiaceae bacterium]
MLFFLEVYISVILLSLLLNKKLLTNKINKQLKHKTYKFLVSLDDTGIEYATFDYRVKINWPSVTGVVNTENYIHIYNDLKEELFIPKKAFNNEDDIRNFLQKVNDQMKGKN